MKFTNIFKLKAMIGLLASLLIASPAFSLDQAEFNKMMGAYLADDKNMDSFMESVKKHAMAQQQKMRADAAQAEEKQLEEQFKNPVKIDITGSPSKGPKDAKVTVVEFSDFECPYCSRGKDVMEEILKAYPKDVKVVFKHLPLSFHKNAKPASIAAMAAGEQGKFWEMHDILFQNQKSLSDELYMKSAKDLGLDMDKFKKDYASGNYDKLIESDMAIASKNGIRGTPGFFVNGVAVKGARPFPYFKQLIDRWLKEGGTAPAAAPKAAAAK